MRDTWPLLAGIEFPPLARRRMDTLQVNVGYRCNQSCVHCHVGASPQRTEEMASETVDLVVAVLAHRHISTLDITGGAPELNPHFRRLVRAARDLGVRVIDRCNLTILEAAGQEDLAQFLKLEQVEIVASLPCYLAYNPQGPSLPPPQEALEADYRRQLGDKFGIVFNRLFTLANMPIQRFGSTLISKGEFDRYMGLLRQAHRDDNLDSVMCRDLVSVDWRGYLYDCDFNQMLDLPLTGADSAPRRLEDLLTDDLDHNPIQVAGHCYGCTAGQGSSCGGALKEAAE